MKTYWHSPSFFFHDLIPEYGVVAVGESVGRTLVARWGGGGASTAPIFWVHSIRVISAGARIHTSLMMCVDDVRKLPFLLLLAGAQQTARKLLCCKLRCSGQSTCVNTSLARTRGMMEDK